MIMHIRSAVKMGIKTHIDTHMYVFHIGLDNHFEPNKWKFIIPLPELM